MKRLLMGICLFTFTIFSPALSSEGDSYPVFLKSFFKTFAKAEKVNWTEVNGLTRIEFMMDGKKNYAYYNQENSLLVVTTPMQISELPEHLRTGLSKQYKKFKVKAVFESTIGNRKSYLSILSNGKKQVVVKAGKKRWSIIHAEIF